MKKRITAIGIALAGLLALVTWAAAQAPLLGISAPQRITHHLQGHPVTYVWKVLLTNNYRYPVTAYALGINGGLSNHGGLSWDDSIPGSMGLHPPLPPGETASVVVGGRGTKDPLFGTPPVVEDEAVIYADGATAGDATLIAHFLLARAVLLAELPSTIARLQFIAEDPGSDRTSVLADFKQQASEERDLMRDSSRAPRLPRVSGSVIADLETQPHKSLQKIAGDYVRIFRRWQFQLQQSKPKLANIPFPPVGGS